MQKQQSLTQERGDFEITAKVLRVWAYYLLQLLQTSLIQDVHKLDRILQFMKDKEEKKKKEKVEKGGAF